MCLSTRSFPVCVCGKKSKGRSAYEKTCSSIRKERKELEENSRSKECRSSGYLNIYKPNSSSTTNSCGLGIRGLLNKVDGADYGHRQNITRKICDTISVMPQGYGAKKAGRSGKIMAGITKLSQFKPYGRSPYRSDAIRGGNYRTGKKWVCMAIWRISWRRCRREELSRSGRRKAKVYPKQKPRVLPASMELSSFCSCGGSNCCCRGGIYLSSGTVRNYADEKMM